MGNLDDVRAAAAELAAHEQRREQIINARDEAIWRLRSQEHLSYRAIAAVAGISEGRVRGIVQVESRVRARS